MRELWNIYLPDNCTFMKYDYASYWENTGAYIRCGQCLFTHKLPIVTGTSFSCQWLRGSHSKMFLRTAKQRKTKRCPGTTLLSTPVGRKWARIWWDADGSSCHWYLLFPYTVQALGSTIRLAKPAHYLLHIVNECIPSSQHKIGHIKCRYRNVRKIGCAFRV